MDAAVKTKASATTETPSTIKRVGIIGAGQMGSGIAHVIAMSGYSCAWTRVTTSFHSTPVFITLRFSADATFLRRVRASSKATRATRRISLLV